MRRADILSDRRRDLADAVAADVIDAQAAERLAAWWETREGARAAEDEPLRLVSGFNDIFVLFGLALICSGLLWFFEDKAGIAVAASAWGFSEIFARRRRMALPSIALALAFASSALFVAPIPWVWDGSLSPFPKTGLALAALASLYYWRFRVPIAAALAALGLVGAAFTGIASAAGVPVGAPLWLGAGLTLFALAMWRDMRDPERVTLDADIAFWLHLTAAPMIVHAVMNGICAGAEGFVPRASILFWAVIAVIWLVGVVIDRRPLIASSVTYIVAAIMDKPKTFESLPVALLAAGGAMLALSIWWRPIRRAVVSILPTGSLRSRLFPVDGP